MKELIRKDLLKKLRAYREGKVTPQQLGSWAVQVHMEYENGDLAFEPGWCQKMFDVLCNLIHNEDEAFRIEDDELNGLIRELEGP